MSDTLRTCLWELLLLLLTPQVQQQLLTQGKIRAGTASSAGVASHKAWLEETIRTAVAEREANEKVARELARRERIVKKKEAYAAQKRALLREQTAAAAAAPSGEEDGSGEVGGEGRGSSRRSSPSSLLAGAPITAAAASTTPTHRIRTVLSSRQHEFVEGSPQASIRGELPR